MQLGIIGLGVIGKALNFGFQRLGHDVAIHDIKLETNLKDVLNTEIVFICVPTPASPDGSCDTSIVENCVGELVKLNYKGVIAIKSTTTPGTCQKLSDKYCNVKICFVPEFLRERSAETDFTENHDLLAVGTENEDVFQQIVKAHGHYPKETIRLTPIESEFLKYFSNGFNALKVVFAVQFYQLCKSMGADYKKVKDAYLLRNTKVNSYLDANDKFLSYGGPCLVKDNLCLAKLAEDLELPGKLFKKIHQENEKYKKTVFEGMRIA